MLGGRVGLCVAVATSVGLVGVQLRRGQAAGDQSGATYFNSYARAVLGPLPPKAVLLINNDQMVRLTMFFERLGTAKLGGGPA